MSEREDNFGNGIFWEYYKDLERQFENFLEYVPYLDGNENTYSFRLANIILAIGAHVDSAFKEIAEYPEFSSKYSQDILRKIRKGKPTIRDYYIFATEYNLSQRKVIFKRLPEREELIPFQQYQKVGDNVKTPNWWRVYNGVKHKFSENFKKASLQNTRDALAGAFLLNVIHKPAIFRLREYGVLKETSEIPDWQFKEKVKKGEKVAAIIETPIFKYDYYQ